MAKTDLQREAEAHYELWLARRQQTVKGERGARLEAVFTQVEKLAHLRFKYDAGLVDEAEVKAELRRALEELHGAI